MAVLPVQAREKSTYVVTLTFTDAAGTAVTPDSVVWSLTDGAGTVINSRSAVVAVAGETVTIVLSGADLALQAGEGTYAHRLLTVEATYSSTEGAGLTLKEEYALHVAGLVKVT